MLHEKTSVLTAHQIPTAPNGTTLPVLANVSIVPAEAANINGSFFAAEIVISEPSEAFPDPIIYVSNRNLGPEFDERGDTIAIFEYSALTGNGTEPEPESTESLPSTDSTVAEPSATQTIRLAPAFTTLVAAQTTPAAKRAEPRSKRMVKYHARRRNPHEQARRQGDYGYGDGSSPEPEASSSTGAAPTGTTLTLVTSSETATATSAGPIQATATPTAATLRLTNQVFTGLSQIRSFAIGKTGDGGDEFLIAGANTEGGVAVFRRIDGGKNLELVVRNQELQNRTSFVFL